MDPNILSLILQLCGGAAGGNIAGTLLKSTSLGPIWNTVAGIAGGLGVGKFLGLAAGTAGAATGGGIDVMTIVLNLLGSGVGGGALPILIGLVRNQVSNRA